VIAFVIGMCAGLCLLAAYACCKASGAASQAEEKAIG
jgi:hypothetical protein